MGPESETTGSIYGLCEPDGTLRYIGMTQHIRAARAGGRTHRDKWIRKLLLSGSEPVVWIMEENIPTRILGDRERAWIAACRSWGCRLVNQMGGGEGFNDPTGAIAAKISATLKDRGVRPPSRAGTTHSIETRAKMSATRKGRQLSEEHRSNLSLALKGRTLSPEWRAKIAATLKQQTATRARDAHGRFV